MYSHFFVVFFISTGAKRRPMGNVREPAVYYAQCLIAQVYIYIYRYRYG